MGMDVSGLRPRSEAGVYFRASVWSWRPVWSYSRELAPDLIDDKMFAACSCKDGKGLDAKQARELGNRVLTAVKTGDAALWIERRRRELDAMEDEDCDTCGGTGRRLALYEGPGEFPCNGCGGDYYKDTAGTGKRRPLATCYGTDIERVEQWGNFLVNCGGFEVW